MRVVGYEKHLLSDSSVEGRFFKIIYMDVPPELKTYTQFLFIKFIITTVFLLEMYDLCV